MITRLDRVKQLDKPFVPGDESSPSRTRGCPHADSRQEGLWALVSGSLAYQTSVYPFVLADRANVTPFVSVNTSTFNAMFMHYLMKVRIYVMWSKMIKTVTRSTHYH